MIPNDNFVKIENACKAFNCVPYFALVIDEEATIKVFILSKERLLQYFEKKERAVGWKMSKSWIEKYESDRQIIKINFDYQTRDWWIKK